MIEVEVLCEHPNNANTYIVKYNGKALIIDPANDIRSIKTLLKNNQVTGILLTHGHYDHFKTIDKMIGVYNCKYYMHKNAMLKLKNVDTSCARHFGYNTPCMLEQENVSFVNEGSVIDLGEIKIKCYYKPGHTDCSMVYQIEDNLFTGDFLFQNSIGRCDLPTGSNLVMYRSLNEIKQFGKGADYTIYPGHGDSTTLHTEIKNNYYLLKN